MPILAQLGALFTNAGLAAAGAAAVTIPVAIHLLTRLRRRSQPWAAMRFLLEAYRRQRQRIQLEQLLLLLVRCLIVLVLGLALAGPLLGGLFRGLGVDTSGRLVVLVIDDGLSTQASPDGRRRRFEELRQTALRILDDLRPADRVAVHLAARPHRPAIAPPTLDHAQARQVVESLRPRHSRGDWTAALADVSSMLAEQRADRDRALVVLLSDFSAGSLAIDRPPPAELASLGERARLLVSRPMPEAPNAQIVSLRPRRHMILAGDARGQSIPLELRLRRFAPQTPDALTGITLAVTGDDPAAPITAVQREHRWSPGQLEATLTLDLPLPADALAAAGASPPRWLTVHASLDPGQTADVLAADNHRYAVVERRDRLRVAIVDDPSAGSAAAAGGFAPREWLSLALTLGRSARGDRRPAGADGGPIELIDLPAAALDPPQLAEADAAMVLRPDLLGPQGWDALRELADRGGVAWIFLPNLDAPAVWTAALRDRLGLEWQVGIERIAPTGDAAPAGSPGRAAPAAPPSWTLSIEGAPPEPLRLLGGDWQTLLRPIRIYRRLALDPRGGPDAAWLRIAGAEASGDGGDALLAEAAVGEGRVLFLATALDIDWTNLPTRPLFVPLLHETLRGALGAAPEAVRLATLVAGDRPALGRRWEGAAELAAQDRGPRVLLARTDAGLEPTTPLEEPGVYVARPAAAAAGDALADAPRLAVNVDADAGDTRALDAAVLGQWLTGLGPWDWLDADRPAAALRVEQARSNFGWPLLWVVLALVIVESALARWFSHAKRG